MTDAKSILSSVPSKKMYRFLFNEAVDGIALTDLETGVILDCNKALAKLLGRKKSKITGQPQAILYPPEDIIDGFSKSFLKYRKGKKRKTVETRVITQKGEIKFVEINVKVIEVDGQKISQEFFRDITERKQMEEVLEENKEKYRMFSEVAFEAIFISEKGVCLEQNETAAQMFGYSDEEALGRVGTEWIAPEDREMVMENMLAGYEEPFKATALRKDGSTFPAMIQGKTITYQGRRVYVTSLRDITERKQMEEALRRRAEEMSALQKTVLGITTTAELPELLVSIVKQATELLHASSGGLYLTEAQHQRVRCVVSYNTPRDFTGTLLDYGEGAAGSVAQTGRPLIIDDYRKWSGRASVYEEEQPFQAIISVPLIWQGNVTGVIHALRERKQGKFSQEELKLLTLFADHAAVAVENARLYGSIEQELTERKRSEEALEESEKRFRNIYERVEDVIYETDPTGRITGVSPSIEKHSGYRPEELIGQKTVDFYLYPDESAALWSAMEAEGSVSDFEIHTKKKNGEISVFSVNAHVVYDTNGQPVKTEGILRDITERVRAEEALRESEERYRNIYTRVNDIIYETDFNGHITGISPSVERNTGYRPEELIGRNVLDFYAHPDEYEALWGEMEAAGTVNDFKIQLKKKNGEIIDISITAHIVFDADGQPVKTEGVLRDISKRVQAEDALKESEERYRNLFNSVPVGIYRSTPDGRFLDGNPALIEILGFPDQETMLAANIKDLYLDESVRDQELVLIEQGDVISNYRMQLRRYDDAVIWVQDSANAVRNSSGQTVHYYGRLEDITERTWTEMELQRANKQLQTHLAEIKELEAALREQATRDPLTGLFNRRHMEDVLKQELARASRKKEPLSVVILDLDRLKEINDIYGHMTGGDKALQILADTLKQMCREEDTPCRYGGDEFLVILYDTPAQVAYERASQWKEAVAKIKIASNDREFGITFSAGVAAFPTHGSTVEGILLHADRALYRAKELGRDQVMVYQQGGSK